MNAGTPFVELAETGVDTNSTATVSAAIDVRQVTKVGFSIANASGGSSTHVVGVEQSFDDGTTYTEITGSTITSVGVVDNIDVVAAGKIRLFVKTAEGAASTSNWALNGK